MTRYAASTSVSSAKSKAEIEQIVERYGAEQFFSGWDATRAGEVLRDAAERAISFLENTPLESGCCMCGDPVAGHGMHSGHSPVDDLAYYAGQVAEDLKKALTDQQADAKGEGF